MYSLRSPAFRRMESKSVPLSSLFSALCLKTAVPRAASPSTADAEAVFTATLRKVDPAKDKRPSAPSLCVLFVLVLIPHAFAPFCLFSLLYHTFGTSTRGSYRAIMGNDINRAINRAVKYKRYTYRGTNRKFCNKNGCPFGAAI